MMVGAELAHQRQHVAAEALLVGGRMAGLVDAAIDAAAEMLDEGAEQARVGLADGEVAVEEDAGVTHAMLLRSLPVELAGRAPASAGTSGDSTDVLQLARIGVLRVVEHARARRRFRPPCPSA